MSSGCPFCGGAVAADVCFAPVVAVVARSRALFNRRVRALKPVGTPVWIATLADVERLRGAARVSVSLPDDGPPEWVRPILVRIDELHAVARAAKEGTSS